MDTKKELITNTVSHLLKFARKFTFMETMPIKIDKDREITTNEAHIIQAIGENEEINITSLSKLFGVTKSATSQMISKLSKNGYVKKQQAPYSNKEYLLSLTEPGWQAYHAHKQFHGREMDELINRLSSFSSSQIATISVMLETINDIIDERIFGVPEK